jgi:putative two-component system response regulator
MEGSVGNTAARPDRLIGEPDRRRILIVDDESSLRDALSRFLDSRGYIVQTAADGGAALRELRSQQYALLLSDVRLPDAYGVDLVDSALAHDPDLAVILLTGYHDPSIMSAAFEHGAMDYLTKPVPLDELEQAIERALARRTLSRERRQLESFIEREVAKETEAMSRERDTRTIAIGESLARLCMLHEESLGFMAGTSTRVATVAAVIAEMLGITGVAATDLLTAAPIRNIGLIAVPPDLLSRPGPLGEAEFAVVRQHVALGVEILAPLGFHEHVIDFVHSHHEHWDGSGYPRRLAGPEIPVGGRILCAAETFVALISPRPFRPAMTSDATLQYLTTHSGGLLDPAIYDALAHAVRDGHILGLGT